MATANGDALKTQDLKEFTEGQCTGKLELTLFKSNSHEVLRSESELKVPDSEPSPT